MAAVDFRWPSVGVLKIASSANGMTLKAPSNTRAAILMVGWFGLGWLGYSEVDMGLVVYLRIAHLLLSHRSQLVECAKSWSPPPSVAIAIDTAVLVCFVVILVGTEFYL